MSQTPLLITRFQQVPSKSFDHAKSCPFASNCSCVFARADVAEQPTPETATTSTSATPAAASEAARAKAAIKKWTDLGWKVTARDANEVFLERTHSLPFCLNAFLTLATGFLWLAYWIPRSRHPKVDRKVITVP